VSPGLLDDGLMTNNTTDHPTPDHVVTVPDGRTVAVDEHGTPDGPVVVLLHSSPGSRLLDPDPAATTGAGIRLLTLDRPGFGDSSPLPDGAIPRAADRADDVAAVLSALAITDAAIVGWSHGGHVAAGMAARHPHLVRSLALVGTPAPDDEVPWLLDFQRAMLPALRADPAGAPAQLAPVLADMARDLSVVVANSFVGNADEALYRATQPALDRYLNGAIRQGPAGLASDIVANSVVPWGFDPRAIGAPVHLFYGDADVVVPPPHADWWHGQLADSTVHLVPGAGHLLILPAWKDILTALG
jgi:pimeloyl-ACP methyl ester carboxylesterase